LSPNKLLIKLNDPEMNPDLARYFTITMKQATRLLIKVDHVFSEFVKELVMVKEGRVVVRDIVRVLDPNKGQGFQSKYYKLKRNASEESLPPI
jgi:hypothetical protein